MEKINLGYSIKNIPIPHERVYLLQLVEKIEAVIKRMRWKATFYNKKKNEGEQIPERYGIKSDNCPKQIKELLPFEDELILLLNSIKFRKVKNDFQQKLNNDIKMIKSSEKTITPADKTSNMYRLDKTEYDNLLQSAITTSYKKANSNMLTKINKAGKCFAKDAKILDNIYIYIYTLLYYFLRYDSGWHRYFMDVVLYIRGNYCYNLPNKNMKCSGMGSVYLTDES